MRAPQRLRVADALTDGDDARLRGDQRQRHRLGNPERGADLGERLMVLPRQRHIGAHRLPSPAALVAHVDGDRAALQLARESPPSRAPRAPRRTTAAAA